MTRVGDADSTEIYLLDFHLDYRNLDIFLFPDTVHWFLKLLSKLHSLECLQCTHQSICTI